MYVYLAEVAGELLMILKRSQEGFREQEELDHLISEVSFVIWDMFISPHTVTGSQCQNKLFILSIIIHI